MREAFKIVLESLKRMARDCEVVPVFVNSDNQVDSDLFPHNADGVMQRIEMADMRADEADQVLKSYFKALTDDQIKDVRQRIGSRACHLRHLQRKLGKEGPSQPFASVIQSCEKMIQGTAVDLRMILYNTSLNERACTPGDCIKLLHAVARAGHLGLQLGEQDPGARKFLITQNVLALGDTGHLKFSSTLQRHAFQTLNI